MTIANNGNNGAIPFVATMNKIVVYLCRISSENITYKKCSIHFATSIILKHILYIFHITIIFHVS